MRAMVGIGVQDRGGLVFPAEQQGAFLAALPEDLRVLEGEPDPPVFARTAAAAEGLDDAPVERPSAHGRSSLCFKPAGRQWVRDRLFEGVAASACATLSSACRCSGATRLRASAAAVCMTMVDGRVLYRDGSTHLDPETMAAAAARASEASRAAVPKRGEAVARLVDAVTAFHRARWR